MVWVSLGIALTGVVIALVGGFCFQSVQWVVTGIVIALIGIWFRPRGG